LETLRFLQQAADKNLTLCYNNIMSDTKVNLKPGFVGDIMEELKKVSWPTRKQTVRLTLVVIVISLIIAAYIGIIDVLLAKVLEFLTQTR